MILAAFYFLLFSPNNLSVEVWQLIWVTNTSVFAVLILSIVFLNFIRHIGRMKLLMTWHIIGRMSGVRDDLSGSRCRSRKRRRGGWTESTGGGGAASQVINDF